MVDTTGACFMQGNKKYTILKDIILLLVTPEKSAETFVISKLLLSSNIVKSSPQNDSKLHSIITANDLTKMRNQNVEWHFCLNVRFSDNLINKKLSHNNF